MSKRRPLHEGEEQDTDISTVEESVGYTSDISEKRCEGKAPAMPGPSMAFLALPWHASMVLFYSLLLYYGIHVRKSNQHIIDPDGRIPAVGGLFKYLTHINQWIQLAFFTIQLLTDVTPCRYKAKLQKVSSFIFTTLTFPGSALVATTFWGIYAIDRKYIYPEIFDKFVPGYLNHFWHTTILLWVLCEIYLVLHEFPTTAMASIAIFTFGFVYIGWIFYIFFTASWWVYPFMKHLPPVFLSLFFGVSLFYLLGLFLVGKYISYTRWGTTYSMKELKRE